MPEQLTKEIMLASKSHDPTSARMQIVSFTPQEQKMRAIKALLTLWLIAALCVLIPIAHFILVPGFLIAGGIAAFRKWKLPAEGREASGECPDCHHAVHIDLEKNSDLPQWHNCPECGVSLELTESTKSPA